MPLPRWKSLDEARKAAILGAAAEEFSELGFAKASYNRIIDRAGLSKGAMYYYFADKEDLFTTVMETALTRWFSEVGLPTSGGDAKGFWKACEETYAKSVRFMLRDRLSAALCFAVTRARENLDAHPFLAELSGRMRDWTTALVRQGKEAGAVRDDVPEDLLVEVALSMMDAGDRYLAKHWREMTPALADETAKNMVDLLRRVATKEKKR